MVRNLDDFGSILSEFGSILAEFGSFLVQFKLNMSPHGNGPNFGANSEPFLEKVRIRTKWSEFGPAKNTGSISNLDS